MKKETIFKHELNESIQANAALNCLKNRNNHKQLNETSDFDARFEFRKDLRELASPIAKKAYMIIRKQYGDIMWRQLGMDDCDEQGLIDMLNMYAEDGLKPQQIVNKMMGVREDEETVDYAQLADDVCASYRGPLSKLDLKDSINYIVKMVAKKIGKTVDTLTPQELSAIQKAAKHSVWYVSEQEEHPEDADRLQSQLADAWDEGMEDDEDDYVPYENKFDETHHDIVDSILEEVYRYFQFETDVEGFNLTDYTEEQIGKAIEQILDKTDDFPSSVSNNVCYAWVRKHAEEIIRILETGGLENSYEGHPEFEFSEQEELPQMERHDLILALSEYMSESWIAIDDEDGDLDDIYYAVADILDKTGDYPASTSWEDCKPWCQKHYREVEAKLY